MARKELRHTITSEGRDKGKVFILTEMPSDQGERIANRMIFALLNTGAAIPEEALGAGWAALAAVGVQAIGMLRYDTVQSILEEAWAFSVRYQHSPQLLPQEIIPGVNSPIEEVRTRYEIHLALWKLHTGFSLPVGLPTSGIREGDINPSWISSMSHALLGLLSRLGMRP
jgi:hypothetical protein